MNFAALTVSLLCQPTAWLHAAFSKECVSVFQVHYNMLQNPEEAAAAEKHCEHLEAHLLATRQELVNSRSEIHQLRANVKQMQEDAACHVHIHHADEHIVKSMCEWYCANCWW